MFEYNVLSREKKKRTRIFVFFFFRFPRIMFVSKAKPANKVVEEMENLGFFFYATWFLSFSLAYPLWLIDSFR